jgi:hypothetical protein
MQASPGTSYNLTMIRHGKREPLAKHKSLWIGQ